MPEVLSDFVRCAMERAREREVLLTRLELVLLLLPKQCGPLTATLQMRVAALDADVLLALAVALLDFTGPDDLRQWLEQHAAQS
jgi:hypothetical protein